MNPCATSGHIVGVPGSLAAAPDRRPSADSPFSAALRTKFAGFAYDDGDAAYCVDATFAPLIDSATVDYPTFNNKTIPFRRAGILQFTLLGKPQSLAAFQRVDLPEDQR